MKNFIEQISIILLKNFDEQILIKFGGFFLKQDEFGSNCAVHKHTEMSVKIRIIGRYWTGQISADNIGASIMYWSYEDALKMGKIYFKPLSQGLLLISCCYYIGRYFNYTSSS